MLNRRVLSAIVAASALAPGMAGAQGLAIDHKAIGCIVAGEYPKFNACFDPAATLARARVFFRGSGMPHWYFVDMRPEAPCFSGILPKPKASLKKIDYYVEAVDKTFAESRTAEYNPDVVGSPNECRRDVLAAPTLRKATVTVGAAAGAPSVPAGFSSVGIVGASGGASTGLIVAGVVGAGAAAAGIALAVSGNNDNTTSTTLGVSSTTPATTAPATTTTSTSTTNPPAQNFVPTLSVNPNPPVGPPPLKVTFDFCGTTGDNLKYFYDFNDDGVTDLQGQCSAKVFYTEQGFSLSSVIAAAPPTLPGCQARCYNNCVYSNKGTSKEKSQCFYGCAQVCPNQGITSSPDSPVRRLSWTSELQVPGATGQVVVNAESAVFAASGRSVSAAPGRRGENRIEAQLVQASGRPGSWRFELGTTSSLEIGSLRVIAGDVSLVSGDAVVFRLSGKPGERVVFAFRTRN
jgi:hypothetical protein